MSTAKILYGEQLVQKGATKHDTSLPEIGLKDVIPNGSWLEQKQIQAALEARKHLLEVERIEKSGAISHAEWDEERGLAAVQQQAGGYWQYCGHHEGGQLYLLPEEALFLMEVNCLRLTFNEVTVSLQQAYSLLLRGKINILQYKVYSSLSRIGYKVLRHEYVKLNDSSGEANDENKSTKLLSNESEDSKKIIESDINKDLSEAELEQGKKAEIDIGVNQVDSKEDNTSTEINTTCDEKTEIQEMEVDSAPLSRKEQKLQKLRDRKIFNKTTVDNSFKNIPEMCRKATVKLSVPEQVLFPRNVFPNKMEYDLNLNSVRIKKAASPPTDTRDRSYSSSDEGNLQRREINDIQPASSFQNIMWNPRLIPQCFPPRFQYGPPRFWNNGRPRFNNIMFMQRPNFYPSPNLYFPPRGPLFFNLRPNMNQCRGRRKRSHEESQHILLQRVKFLTEKLKQLSNSGAIQQISVDALKGLLRTYNLRYNTKLCLTNNFNLVEDESIETIELDEDEPRAKVPKKNDDEKNYKESFSQLKDLAQKLKVLDSKSMLYSRHRRAFSNLIKEFNKTYKADVILDSANDVIDRNLIILDSSDSDCVVEEPAVEGKKVLNPFNVLMLQLRKDDQEPSTSRVNIENKAQETESFCNWAPKDDDFGKREVITKSEVKNLVADVEKEMYIYDFLEQYKHYKNYKNWNQLKTVFWELVQEIKAVETDKVDTIENDVSKDSLIRIEECKDMASALEKIRVIPSCKEMSDDCSIEINFDVYKKDVQNFRKSKKPKPHFRVCCVSESSAFPSGSDIATIHSKYKDNVPLAFAIVSSGSISYLQFKPGELPVYVNREEEIG